MVHMFMLLAAATIALGIAPQACAQQQWKTVGDSALASMRGGFAVRPGLMVSFGIVRTIRVDGAIVNQTRMHIEDLRSISVDEARQLAQQLGSTTVVQIGSGNAVHAATAAQLAPGVLIQNTENNRQIQAVTELNAVTNGVGLLQSLNLNQTLSDALKGAFGR